MLRSCCNGCHVGSCAAHSPPALISLAGQEAGCLVGKSFRYQPGHRLIYDGRFPELMHLHHEGYPDVLLFDVRDPNESLPGEVLAWIEAVHWGWLGD